VVDAGQRLGPGRRQTLPDPDSDQETTGETWTSGHGDEVEVCGLNAGAVQCEVEKMREAFEVVPRRQLGDHTAELLVQLDLGVDDVGEDFATILDYRDGSLVAACFDAQD
jgi:hypothetical protein